ncbi:MAG: rod shape-determining protein RodA [Muribaculaceae bacterium]|nr:rod shape-determining protein RodA [Muribaculaceae bacterium]MBQ7212448.1 rod shape-determining protein RodA [Muribaculaceae bacterium]
MDSSRGNQSLFQNIDWLTVILYLVLVVTGVFCIYAASYDFDDASIFDFNEFSGKQLTWIGLAFVIGLVILLIDWRVYETYAYPIYILLVIILFLTIFIGTPIKGSRSWIAIGSTIRLQPAEFAKFATALALAKLFNSYNFVLNQKASNYYRALLIIFLPVLLIIAQRETGSALVYFSLFLVLYREGMSGIVLLAALFAVTFFVVAVKFTDTLLLGIPMGEAAVLIMIMMLIVGMVAIYAKNALVARNIFLGFVGSGIIVAAFAFFGLVLNGYVYFLVMITAALVYCFITMWQVKTRQVTFIISATVVSVVFLFLVNFGFNSVLEPHQQLRIKVVLGIEDDLRGAGYNVNQSKIAIGSGGLYGKGFLNGTQTKLKYVPEQHTDFIFCTIGEERGFIGTAAVIAAFLFLILRIIRIAERQPRAFGRVYAYCVASYLIFHFAVNIGMVIGLCPVIGIPLPFFSYGGSSLWGFTILLFVLLRIDAGRRDNPAY